MHNDNIKGMLPVGAFRNYNCWACGYQRLSGDWLEAHLWGPIPDDVIPPLLDDVLVRMQNLGCWAVGEVLGELEGAVP